MAKWYPGKDQLKDPESTQRVLKQVLDQHYALQDAHEKLQVAHAELKGKVPDAKASPFPPGSGPSDSIVCGLPVQPVDVQTLADGTKLTFVKSSGNFKFM